MVAPGDMQAMVAPGDMEAISIFMDIMQNPMADDPYPGYHRLRSKAPVLSMPDGTPVLSRHADCDAAMRHRSLGKTDDMRGYMLTPIPEETFTYAMRLMMHSMSFANPPEHTRLRQHV